MLNNIIFYWINYSIIYISFNNSIIFLYVKVQITQFYKEFFFSFQYIFKNLFQYFIFIFFFINKIILLKIKHINKN